MDPTEESQTLEITALQSIYPDEFIQVPPPKAWKVRALFLDFKIAALNFSLGCLQASRVYHSGFSSRSRPCVED